jgi:hypothetical protein
VVGSLQRLLGNDASLFQQICRISELDQPVVYVYMYSVMKVKINSALGQATKAQRRIRDTALLFL